MKYYELLYIVNPNFEEDRVNKIIEEIGNEIDKHISSIINHRTWGKKRLAYAIDNHKYGTYILMQFETENVEFLVEFDTFLKLHKSVIRHQLVRLDKKPEKIYDVELEEKDEELITEDSGFAEETETEPEIFEEPSDKLEEESE